MSHTDIVLQDLIVELHLTNIYGNAMLKQIYNCILAKKQNNNN